MINAGKHEIWGKMQDLPYILRLKPENYAVHIVICLSLCASMTAEPPIRQPGGLVGL